MRERSLPALALPALVATAALLVQGVLASAIVVRHDRDQARFLELGERYGNPLVLVRARDEAGIVVSEGTLIAPRFVLTAAHVARNLSPSDSLVVGDRAHAVARVALHPQWDPDAWVHDIAVVELSLPVAGVDPVPLYRWNDEAGREVVVVGRGMYGTGRTGPVEDDGMLRGATNRIDRVLPEWLRFTFDEPGSPGVTDLEGISGPGDSGGPALTLRDGETYLIGVSSAQDDSATGGRPGRYGVHEYYVRVSVYADWIDEIVAVPEASRPLTSEEVSAIRRGADDVDMPSEPVAVALHGESILPLVEVTIGRQTFRFLVDLGSNVTIVRRDVADRSDMEVVLDRERNDIVRTDSIAIGSMVFRDVWMGAYDELDVDGVLGYNLLSRFPFELDYPGRRLVLGWSRATVNDVEYVVEDRLPYLPGRIGDREVRLNLDTGATDRVTLPAAWASWLPIESEPAPGPVLRNEQTGAHRVDVARLAADLRVGDLVFERPRVYLNPTVDDAWLGSGILRDYIVSMDPGARRVRLTRPPVSDAGG